MYKRNGIEYTVIPVNGMAVESNNGELPEVEEEPYAVAYTEYGEIYAHEAYDYHELNSYGNDGFCYEFCIYVSLSQEFIDAISEYYDMDFDLEAGELAWKDQYELSFHNINKPHNRIMHEDWFYEHTEKVLREVAAEMYGVEVEEVEFLREETTEYEH